MRLALTGGGTGGHIFPALAVMEALRASEGDSLEVRFFGPENRGERRLVDAAGVAFETVPSAGVRGRGPVALVRSAWSLLSGIVAAFRKLRAFKPDAIFSTGGYGSFPASVAAKLLRRPLVVYLPDVSPGWAVRAEKLLATRMTTTTGAALAHLPAKKTVVTGYPVRDAFFSLDREATRESLGLNTGALAVVIAGASQGARAINTAVFAALPELLPQATIFHITGEAGFEEATRQKAQLRTALAANYQPAAFRADLPSLMVACDLGVFRAGASVLGEVPAAKLPSVLIPGTFAGGHQRDNARWLAEGGAATVLEEADISNLGEVLAGLLTDTPRRDAMRIAAASLARPDAAAAIAAVVKEVAKK